MFTILNNQIIVYTKLVNIETFCFKQFYMSENKIIFQQINIENDLNAKSNENHRSNM